MSTEITLAYFPDATRECSRCVPMKPAPPKTITSGESGMGSTIDWGKDFGLHPVDFRKNTEVDRVGEIGGLLDDALPQQLLLQVLQSSWIELTKSGAGRAQQAPLSVHEAAELIGVQTLVDSAQNDRARAAGVRISSGPTIGNRDQKSLKRSLR